MHETGQPFDPLDYSNIGRSVVDALIGRPPVLLGEMEPFDGAGIYALYYTGGLEAYAPISSPRADTAIYVGKAIPAGGRKGVAENAEPGQVLYRRLGEHAVSIESAENLRLAAFLCRYLVVEPVWIPLAEQVLIARYRPVWNAVVDGFGNHDPGKGRRDMRRPRWDILHPGRKWAKGLQAAETVEEVVQDIEASFAKRLDER